MTVVVRDQGANALLKRIDRARRGRGAVVGVVGDDASGLYEGTGLTVADVASFHEFGRGVPERSFIRDYFDEHRTEIESMLRRMSRELIAGRIRSLDAGLEIIALKVESGIKARIRAGISPGLAESTKDRKGSSTALIDTGQLLSSITYELRSFAEAS